MHKLENILLCGCGWLGEQLVPALKQAQYTISATSRSVHKVESLITQNICAATFSLGFPFPNYLLLDSFSTTVVLMLPPGRKNNTTLEWESHIQSLIDELFNGEIKHLIFISTTSVYGDTLDREVVENSKLMPETHSAKAHVNIEQYLQQNWPKRTSIVRLAGLIGPNRHPIKTLTGRTLTSSNKVANLIHSDDIVCALLRLIELGPQSLPLHLCSLDHPQRKAYYHASAKAFKLPPAVFSPEENAVNDGLDGAVEQVLQSVGKRINAHASWERLGLTPKYASPFDMLP